MRRRGLDKGSTVNNIWQASKPPAIHASGHNDGDSISRPPVINSTHGSCRIRSTHISTSSWVPMLASEVIIDVEDNSKNSKHCKSIDCGSDATITTAKATGAATTPARMLTTPTFGATMVLLALASAMLTVAALDPGPALRASALSPSMTASSLQHQ